MLRETIEASGLADICDRVETGERLSREDGLRLYACSDLNTLGHMANLVRERMNGDKTFFVRNQHINYTNVCNKGCKFCAFYVLPDQEGAYTLSIDQVKQRVREWLHEQVSEIHMVAGINPRLPYDYYLDILRAVKEIRPGVRIKAYTMIELAEIQRVAKKPIEEVLADLKEAGLDSVPGGGVEVLSDRVHAEIFHLKLTPAGWLEMARKVHEAGLKSNATLLYGHIETAGEKIDHFLQLRELQDETNGFLAFIPLAFHPDNTEMDQFPSTTGFGDLREIAIARLMLDNFPHIKSFWIMISPPMSQVSLWYGADDVDGTILREEITHAAGATTPQALTHAGLVEMIQEAGRVPVERDPLYREIARAS